MLQTFQQLHTKYNMDVRGVVHVGAHKGEEVLNYLNAGIKNIVLFEPLKENFNFILKQDYPKNVKISVCNSALGNTTGTIKMYLSDNDLESSSILEPYLHLQQHSWVNFYGTEEVKIDKLDNFNLKDFNFLNIDVQGYELEVLKGAAHFLNDVDYVYCEVNKAEVYKLNPLINDIDSFLYLYNFKRVETQWYPEADWGDALYIKNFNVFFDVGANSGKFIDCIINNFTNNKIIAVEPNEKLFLELKNKYGNNKNVEILDRVVSMFDNNEIDFFQSDLDVVSTSSLDWVLKSRFANKCEWVKTRKKTITLDKIIETYGSPDLIKIDVEGYELEVLKGLTKKQNEICFEWAEEEYLKVNKTCEHLKCLGYEQFGVVYEDDFLKRPDTYSTWQNCHIHKNIDVNRKELWGMVWVK